MKSILLVTIYNKALTESSTIMSFAEQCKKYHGIVELFVWDNSTDKDIDNSRSKLGNINFSYHKSADNHPLSSVYNKIIDKYSDYDLLFNFDDDSTITEEYFDKMLDAYQQCRDVGMFCPVICYGNLYVSPGTIARYKFDYLKEIQYGMISSDKIIAITSGTALSLPAISKAHLRYDESLDLYGIDLKFSIDYAQRFDKIYIVDYILRHDLSIFDRTEDRMTKIRKLKNGFKAERVIMSSIKASFLFHAYSYLRFAYRYFYYLIIY